MKIIPLMLLSLLPLLIWAANFTNLPTDVVQPDGSVLSLLASGDEFANRLHDADGFSIIQSPVDGYYYYAELSGGEPVASAWRADSSDPHTLGLNPGINISPQKYQARKQAMSAYPGSKHRGPNSGTVNNIVVYIRFSDQTEFADPRSMYDARFNGSGDQDYSLQNFFHKASYDQLNYVSYHYPTCALEVNLSYQDSHPRAYYMPYNAITNPQGYQDEQRTEREHTLLANAVNAIAAQVPESLNIDADNDSGVDNVCFIIRGPHTAWAELLWAHRWALYTENVFINGKQVWDYTFQPENHNNTRTLCHEMFHSAGAPDLYHYTYNGMTPAGCWDIMESGNGQMGMYMKAKYGEWIDDIPIIGPGTYTLDPVTSPVNNALRIALSGNDFLVLEYRKQGADIFEEGLPGSGLLIYRINGTLDGNADGPPDEVYVYRPNGTQSVNGLIADAAFSAQNYRTEFNQYTNPRCFLSSGISGNVNIHDISIAGESITFSVSSTTGDYPPVIGTISPADSEILTPSEHLITASVTAPSSTVANVEFSLDGALLGSDNTNPYTLTVSAGQFTPGMHDIVVTAYSANGMQSAKRASVRVVDPQQQTWFSWLSDEPVWDVYGRGSIPIQAALELDLGTQEYVVKKIAFNVVPDPWGFPANPGLVSAKINRFANGAITEQTLLNIGDITSPLDGRFEYTVNSTVPISGQIVVILDLYEYQNMVFDITAPCGNTWITEPNRPWTDALGRGILGSAAIELLLQAPNVSADDETVPALVTGLCNNPNPFHEKTSISFELKFAVPVELTVYNIKGQQVRKLVKSDLTAGSHIIDWDGKDSSGRELGSGIYLYRLSAGTNIRSGRTVLLK